MGKKQRADRIGSVLVGTHIEIELAKDFQVAARIHGSTAASLLKDFVREKVDKWRAEGLYEKISDYRTPVIQEEKINSAGSLYSDKATRTSAKTAALAR